MNNHSRHPRAPLCGILCIPGGTEVAEKGTGAVILAAGKSEYMEELRPLMKVGRTTMIQREIDTLRQAGISPIVVVTGYHA